MVLMLFSLGCGFSFLSENLGKLGLDLRSIIFENSTHSSCNIQRPEIKICNTSRRMPIRRLFQTIND